MTGVDAGGGGAERLGGLFLGVDLSGERFEGNLVGGLVGDGDMDGELVAGDGVLAAGVEERMIPSGLGCGGEGWGGGVGGLGEKIGLTLASSMTCFMIVGALLGGLFMGNLFRGVMNLTEGDVVDAS